MINQQTSTKLLTRLPLIYGKIQLEDMNTLIEKWGGIDGKYHSCKGVINKLKLSKTETDIKELENVAISMINEEIAVIFNCPHCNVDIRKCGLRSNTTGVQTALVFVTADGNITRDTEVTFQKATFKNEEPITYYCHDCEHKISKDLPLFLFLNNKFSLQTIYTYLTKFRGIDITKLPAMPYLKTKMVHTDIYNAGLNGNPPNFNMQPGQTVPFQPMPDMVIMEPMQVDDNDNL